MNFSKISFDSVDPANLNDKDLNTIFCIEQDMWAREEGLGEYVSCGQCEQIFSKQDIYKGKIDNILYEKTVFDIEKAVGCQPKYCCKCHGDLEHIFEKEEYIVDIQKRYSHEALLLLMKEDSQVTGFIDGYAADFDTIFTRELSYRYHENDKDNIAMGITKALRTKIPGKLFSCSTIGTTEKYMKLPHIYNLLQTFFSRFPSEYANYTGISEVSAGGTLDKIYRSCGAQKIHFPMEQSEGHSTGFDSTLLIQEKVGVICKDAFSSDLKSFLKQSHLKK